MSGGYQTQIFNQPAQAVPGDFASANPKSVFPAGPGGLVAGASGAVVGLAAWIASPTDPNGTGQIANNFGSGSIAGIIYNDTEALNTIFLSDAGMTIPQGLPVALLIEGDIWVKNDGASEAQPGQKAYANFSNGKFSFAATSSASQGASVTGSISAQTASFTGSIAGPILTVTAVGAGLLVPGETIVGVGISSGTLIQSQLTGAANGTGTYLLNQSQQQNVASEAMTGTYGLLSVTAVGSGALAVGGLLGGTGVAANSTITGLGTGTGGTGTYYVSPTQAMSSSTVTQTANVETKWTALSAAQPGGLVKISSYVGAYGSA